jgi:hypothetical protein
LKEEPTGVVQIAWGAAALKTASKPRNAKRQRLVRLALRGRGDDE